MGEIKRPPVVDKNDPRYFELRTAQVKAVKSDDGTMTITGIASSSAEDRMGDILTDTCQVSMLEQLSGGDMTMWLNHSYQVPEDILGTCTGATLQRSADGILELAITVQIDGSNPRAVKSWQHIENGTKLGFSIGGYFKNFDFMDDSWGLIVNDIELLEISLVGIPANPRAYTKFVEAITSKLSAEVVKRAEEIAKDAKDASEARVLVRKSFGLVEEIVADDPQPDDVREALEAIAAAPAEEELQDAEVVNDALAAQGLDAETDPNQKTCDNNSDCTCELHQLAARAVIESRLERKTGRTVLESGVKSEFIDLDPDTALLEVFHCGAESNYPVFVIGFNEKGVPDIRAAGANSDMIVECMKCLTAMAGHGLCQESMTSAKMAHAMLKSMLDSEYDVPDDALLPDGDEKSVTLSNDIELLEISLVGGDALSADLSEVQTRIDALKAEAEEIEAKRAAAATELEKLSAERTTLEQQIAQLKATPTGRSTQSSYSGGSPKRGDDHSAYYASNDQLSAAAERQLRGVQKPTDARAMIQRIVNA